MRAPVNSSTTRGMTLVEILVVLVIVGLLVSVTVLSTGMLSRGNTNSDAALAVAEDLSRLFGHASQQALANNEVLGWSLHDDQQMVWWRWASPSQSPALLPQAPVWSPLDESEMNVLDVPADIVLSVNTNMPSGTQQQNQPAVVFFPGREYSVFEIVVRNNQDERAMARIWPERDGLIRWAVL